MWLRAICNTFLWTWAQKCCSAKLSGLTDISAYIIYLSCCFLNCNLKDKFGISICLYACNSHLRNRRWTTNLCWLVIMSAASSPCSSVSSVSVMSPILTTLWCWSRCHWWCRCIHRPRQEYPNVQFLMMGWSSHLAHTGIGCIACLYENIRLGQKSLARENAHVLLLELTLSMSLYPLDCHI